MNGRISGVLTSEEGCFEYDGLVRGLDGKDASLRLASLEMLAEKMEKGEIERPSCGNDVNNHIHTIYSFSPYSPAKALWMALKAGLSTAGIMDHDSVGGIREFIEGGKIIGIATTVGVECRADFSKTPLCGRSMNNPDQKSIAYVALHGIPHTMIDRVGDFFAPYAAERNKRNALMVQRLNKITGRFNVTLDYEKEVVPLSMRHEGGSVTERHILYGLSLKLIEKFGKGPRIVEFLKDKLKLGLSPKVEGYLLGGENEYYEYDLLGALKSEMVGRFYVEAGAECPDIRIVAEFSKEIGAILAYAYLGDVGESATGDKKAQKFEDDYLELLFDVIGELGFNAVTYMPSRNTLEQLRKVKDMCARRGLFQISGEDINSPRQSFVCPALRNGEFKNLVDSTWALIGHEKAATRDIGLGMFSPETVKKYPDLNERIEVFKEIGIG